MRIARVTPPGLVHHVISRFIDKEWLISTDDARARYLALLGRALAHSDWLCLAYAIMSSHLHLAFVAGERPSESWSRRVNPPFVNWLNEHHDRNGSAFAGRATMWISRAAHIGGLLAYIHNNPVRAGVVARASESTWTSHRAYVGLAARPAWLHVDLGLQMAGVAQDQFDAWVHGEREAVLDEPRLEPVRSAAQRVGAIELGTPTRDPLEAMLVARPFACVRPSPARIAQVTAEVSGVDLGLMRTPARGELAVARAIAVIAARSFGLSMSAMAAVLGISPQAASRLAARVLDKKARAMLLVVRDRIERDPDVRFTKVKASPAK